MSQVRRHLRKREHLPKPRKRGGGGRKISLWDVKKSRGEGLIGRKEVRSPPRGKEEKEKACKKKLSQIGGDNADAEEMGRKLD